ncbi:hypothetical protein BH23BAC3_BH23BAC3_31250 [soil metagenome]
MDRLLFLLLILFTSVFTLPQCDHDNETQQSEPIVNLIPVDHGWAQSSVNTVVFRINSIDSYDGKQIVSYYDDEGTVMLAG